MSPAQPSKRSKPRSRDADAAGVAVVDEDRRASRLRVDVRREAADVPAVAHRQQRQHGDLRVLGRVQRARGASALVESLEQRVLRRVPERLGVERRRWQEERDHVDRRAVRDRLALERDDLLGHRHPAEMELDAERSAAVRSGSSMNVSVSFRACVYQSPSNGRTTSDAAPRGRARGRGTARPRCR